MRNLDHFIVDNFPTSAGTYALLLSLLKPAHLRVGALGSSTLQPGFYVYVGSAMGPGGLRGRLAHHLKPAPKPHWHIDYLRQHVEIEQIWYTYSTRCEHAWAAAFQSLPGSIISIPGFGSSDCHCLAHLFYFEYDPEPEVFQRSIACLPITMVPIPSTSHL